MEGGVNIDRYNAFTDQKGRTWAVSRWGSRFCVGVEVMRNGYPVRQAHWLKPSDRLEAVVPQLMAAVNG